MLIVPIYYKLMDLVTAHLNTYYAILYLSPLKYRLYLSRVVSLVYFCLNFSSNLSYLPVHSRYLAY